MSSTVTIRLNEEERKVFAEYSKIYRGGLSTMIKELALEKLQDEYDLAVAEEFEKGLKDGSVTIRPYSELLKETGLE
ncbi:MAG: hypothetical protein IKF68_05750 [Erysipelotrichaceae bacterium]|nr:hypothetical protein [Erysipelotrichaceae bacterium]